MTYEIIRVHEWPKWYTCRCKKCGECVPAGHGHICEKPKEQRREGASR